MAARTACSCRSNGGGEVRLDDAIMRKYFVDGAHKDIATKVRALSDFRELSLTDLYDRMDALWVANHEAGQDFRYMEGSDDDAEKQPTQKKNKTDSLPHHQVTQLVNAAFQKGKGKGKGKGRGAKDKKGGRGDTLPPFARMGMMKKYYSDAEWAKRIEAYENKEKPSDHAKLYSKDRWEDKNSGKKLFCCFKCRTIGQHTMDRCPQFK